MAGDLNTQPPQTYSRLFRPWDCSKVSGVSEMNLRKASSSTMLPVVKFECDTPLAVSASLTNTITVKRESSNIFYCTSPNDSEREYASSSSSCSTNSSAKSSLDESMFMASLCASQNLSSHRLNVLPTHSKNKDFLMTQGTFFNNFEQHNSLFYTPPSKNTSHTLHGLPSPSNFGFDPFALGFMEQEYSRVMAEEAHLKSLNARKQRPKKFKCPHCDVAFSNNGQLKGHIRIHTGERPFKCDVETCGKTFTRNEELTRHKRIHTGLRPYSCTVCGKKFGRRDHLKKHMKTHMQQQHPMGTAIYVPVYPYLYGY